MHRALQLGCVILLCVFVVSACSDSDPLLVAPQSTESFESGGDRAPRPEIPFHAVEENTIVVLPPFPCLPPDYPDLCDPLNPILVSEFPGVITGTHIGEATVLGIAESDLSTGAQTARSVITAANGDQLTFESLVVGVIDPDGNVVFEGEFWFTPEGTGRFANASGGGTLAGTASLNDLVGQYTMDGVISYGPPDPRNVASQ